MVQRSTRLELLASPLNGTRERLGKALEKRAGASLALWKSGSRQALTRTRSTIRASQREANRAAYSSPTATRR